MNMARFHHVAFVLANGKVLVTGGGDSSTELYDPVTGTWSITGSMHVPRTDPAAYILTNGKVFISGGFGGYNNGGYLKSAELYDPTIGAWAITGSMNISRSEHAASVLTNGIVLVSGGYGPGYLNSSELYLP
jgi:hypothetical protein